MVDFIKVRAACADPLGVKVGRRLPSVAFTLSVIGIVLFIPFLVGGAVQLDSARSDVNAARAVQASATDLDLLVRLGPAINDELLAAGFETGSDFYFSGLPEGATALLVGEPIELEDARAIVDALLEDLGDDELSDSVAAARQSVDGELDELRQLGDSYEQLRLHVATRVQQELITLNSAVSATANTSIGRRAQLAAAAAEMQTESVELDGLWALLEASIYVNPAAEELQRFNYGLLRFENRASIFDALLGPDGDVRLQWEEVKTSAAYTNLFERYEATSARFALEGLETNTRDGDVALTIADLGEAVAIASDLRAGFDDAEALDDGLEAVLDAALIDLRLSTQEAVTVATNRRQTTMLWILASSIVVVLAAFIGAALISRPIRRMGEAARKMSYGDLGVEIPETGPAEVRLGAQAINGAIASLRHAEAQAIALAEERLDDPVLDDAAPGELGASLQLAVRRLAESLSERDEIRTKLEYEASHDALTKLANRRAIFNHLDTSLADNVLLGLLFLDLDDFKSLNDAHGHHAGDEILQLTADRVRNAVGEHTIAGRLGGDEFVIVTPPLEASEDARRVAEHVLEIVNQAVTINGTTIVPQASIGIAVSDRSMTADELLRDADLAVYSAKSRGKARIELCTDELRDEADSRADLEDAIRRGLDTDQFELYYQQAVSAVDGSAVDTEALIRWNRDGHGLVAPFEFIPAAERTELIIDVDCWVLREVARTLRDDRIHPGTRIAVNISGRHLSSGKLAQHIRSVITEFDIDPRRLIVEVTETAVLDDLSAAARDLAEIRTLGVQVALDDFGTGFMSLAHLRSLPVDILKIDRSFVNEIDTKAARSIVQLVIDAGHLLDLSVTAEGVETGRQAHLLTKMGADVLQGYWFGRPEPLADTTPTIAVAA